MIAEETWRSIPPEEKLEIAARSHAAGVQAAGVLILIGATMAVAFQSPSVFWSAILGSPIVFQFSSSKKWRTLRPVALLQYLAARSVTRRYAFAVKSVELNSLLLFRAEIGKLSALGDFPVSSDDDLTVQTTIPVWIALFPDAVVIISEKKGGAHLEFGYVINKRFSMEAVAADNKEYSQHLSLYLRYEDRTFGVHRIKIESRFPAALNAFSHKLKSIIDTPRPIVDDFTPDIRQTQEALLQTPLV